MSQNLSFPSLNLCEVAAFEEAAAVTNAAERISPSFPSLDSYEEAACYEAAAVTNAAKRMSIIPIILLGRESCLL